MPHVTMSNCSRLRRPSVSAEMSSSSPAAECQDRGRGAHSALSPQHGQRTVRWPGQHWRSTRSDSCDASPRVSSYILNLLRNWPPL